ncbi:MAG: thioesterase, partial [Methylococcaceae bacterium NSP1-2]
TTSCYFTMVAMDENGKPIEVPRLQLETDTEKQHYAEAELRKQLRQENLQKTRLLAIELSEEQF